MGYDIDGGTALSEVNEELRTDFESEEVDTIGGLVLERLNRAPERGDRVEVDSYVIEITAVEGTRISTVWIHESDFDDPEVTPVYRRS